MTWRERLLPASVDDVPFFVLGDGLRFGTRLQVNTYPERDEHSVDELGREPRTFGVTAHLLGDDVYEQRERLVRVLERRGTKTLVLPSRGELQVYFQGIGRNRELDGAEGRISRFELEFVEAGSDEGFPTAAPDTTAAVRLGIPPALETVAETFGAIFAVVGQPGWVAESAKIAAEGALEALEEAFGGLATSEDTSDSLRALRRAREDVSSLVQGAGALAAAVQEPVLALAELGDEPDTLYRTLQGLRTRAIGTAPDATGGTPARAQERANLRSLERLQRRSLAAALARVGVRLAPESAQDAAALREELGGLLLEEADDAADAQDDADFAALSDLAAAVVADLDARAARLPERRTVVNPETVPALVLAYRVHEDLAREDEIVARNGIRRPGFVPQGLELELVGGEGP